MSEPKQMTLQLEAGPTFYVFWSFVIGVVFTGLLGWALMATHINNRPIKELDIEIIKIVIDKSHAYCKQIDANHYSANLSGITLDLNCKPAPKVRYIKKSKRKGV